MEDLKPIATLERKPLYMQAIDALENLIETGQFTAGEQLPAEETLAEMLGISRSTLREALGHLETRGLISRRQGIGTFITPSYGTGLFGGLERLESFRRLSSLAMMPSKVVDRSVVIEKATRREADLLTVEDGGELIRIRAVETIDGIRCMFLDSAIKPEIANVGAIGGFEGSEIDFLLEEVDPPLSYTRTEVFAIGADERVADRLDIDAGTPILQLVETYFTAKGETLGLAYVYFLTDHFHFYINRRVVGR